jgi:hypothetical protein
MGLAVAGTVSLHAAYAPDLGPLSSTKIWNVSATLRGFYDDNYDTANSGLNPRGSYGFEVSPQIMLAVPLQQTELGLRNTYAMTYYQEREELGQSPVDQSDQLDLWVDHAFTERWQAKLMDTFVVAQEPQLVNTVPTSYPFRVSGSNIRNTATITLNTDWTRLFSTSLSYQNSFYDYQNSGANITDVTSGNGASLAGLLNRVEQTVSLNFNWLVAPETTAFFGGSFEQVNYTGDEPIASNLVFRICRRSAQLSSQFECLGQSRRAIHRKLQRSRRFTIGCAICGSVGSLYLQSRQLCANRLHRSAKRHGCDLSQSDEWQDHPVSAEYGRFRFPQPPDYAQIAGVNHRELAIFDFC